MGPLTKATYEHKQKIKESKKEKKNDDNNDVHNDGEDEEVSYASMAFGNPFDPPLPQVISAMKHEIDVISNDPHPQPSTFSYNNRVEEGIDAAVSVLKKRFPSCNIDPEDVTLTNGALSALQVCIFGLTDPGDEVLNITPSYFLYKPLFEHANLLVTDVPTKSEDDGFDLDVDAIRRAITPKTRLMIINSPNNPTGKIYPSETLSKLSDMLQDVNEDRAKSGIRPVVIVSDESYNRIVFDGREYHSVAEYYPYSIMVYTWAKTLLTPSERLGYIAFSPLMPLETRESLRDPFRHVQVISWAFPNVLVAKAYSKLESSNVSIDIERIQRRRDLFCGVLTDHGWTLTKPEGSFYVFVKVPNGMFDGDDEALVDALVSEKVFVLPGVSMDLPGWIRVSLTASDAMVKFAVDGFCRIYSNKKGLDV